MDLWASIKGDKNAAQKKVPSKTQLTEQERQRRILLQKAKALKEQQRLQEQKERERIAQLERETLTETHTSAEGDSHTMSPSASVSSSSLPKSVTDRDSGSTPKSSTPHTPLAQEITRKPLPSSIASSAALSDGRPSSAQEPSAAKIQADARAADERFARHVRETSRRFAAYRQLIVFASTVLLWQRPLVLGVTCVATHVFLWYSSALLAHLRVLQLLCYLLIIAVCGSSALHYLGITRERLWQLLPPEHGRNALEPLMSYEDVICAYCAVYRTVWERASDLMRYRDQALPFFTFQALVVLAAATYAASMFSGLLLLYIVVFTCLLAPGLFFHEAITRGAKALTPHLKTISSQVDLTIGSVIQKERRRSIADAARRSISEPFSFVKALAGETEGQEPSAQAAGHREPPTQQLTPQQIQQIRLQQQIAAQQQQMAALLAQQQQLGGPLPQGFGIQQQQQQQQQQQLQPPSQQHQPTVSTVPAAASAPTIDPYAHTTAPAQRRSGSAQKKVF